MHRARLVDAPGCLGGHSDLSLGAHAPSCGVTPPRLSSQANPGNPGLNPRNPGTSPGNQGMIPGNPGTSPGNHGMIPGSPRTSPRNHGMIPGNPRTSPRNHRLNPGNPGTSPRNHRLNLGNPGTSPRNHRLNPGSPGTSPGNPRLSPGNPGTRPGSRRTKPGKHGLKPGNPGTSPGNHGTSLWKRWRHGRPPGLAQRLGAPHSLIPSALQAKALLGGGRKNQAHPARGESPRRPAPPRKLPPATPRRVSRPCGHLRRGRRKRCRCF